VAVGRPHVRGTATNQTTRQQGGIVKIKVDTFGIWVLLCLFMTLGIVMFFVELSRGDFRNSLEALVFVAAPICVGIAIEVTKSDIEINDEGISTIRFGRRVKLLEWKEIKAIVDRTKNVKGTVIRSFYVKPYMDSALADGIIIPKNIERFAAFVDVINKYVRQYNIEIERVREGKVEIRDAISVSELYDFDIDSVKVGGGR
jgi:hypothetical protein